MSQDPKETSGSGRLKNFFKGLFQNALAPKEEDPFKARAQQAGGQASMADPLDPLNAAPTGAEGSERVPAAGNPLYELYQRTRGQPLTVDPEATFPLGLFMEEGATPDAEQRAWLQGFEAHARTLLGLRAKEDQAPVPASAQVCVSADKMQAFVFLFPPLLLGEDITPQAATEALEKKGVVTGVAKAKVRTFCEELRYFTLFQVAAGQLPEDGQDGRVIDHFQRETDIRLRVKDDNTIDYKDLGWLQSVREGDVICELTPPTKGTQGHSVLGRDLRAKDGRPAQAPKGQGTKLNEDESQLLAAIEGVVSFDGRFRVDPLLIVQGSVETAVGNLDVVGDVLVHGDVLEGFAVKATGNITIQGRVEGATVEAGGDIQIGAGMNGNGRGVLKAGRDIRCKFIENTRADAIGNLVCDTIIHSDVSSEADIEVVTGRASIIGGSVTALKNISAGTIGNQSSRDIQIRLGNTAAYLREKTRIEKQIADIETELEEMDKNIRYLESAETDGEKAVRADDIRLKQSVQRMQLAKVRRQLTGLAEKPVDIKSCRLRAETIYPPVQISIGHAARTLRTANFSTTLFYKDGEIGIANF